MLIGIAVLSNNLQFFTDLSDRLKNIGPYFNCIGYSSDEEIYSTNKMRNVALVLSKELILPAIHNLVIDQGLEKYQSYFPVKQINVNIATPCYGGQMFVDYAVSLLQSVTFLKQFGITVSPHFISNESLVQRARNLLVAKFMSNPNYDYLLFIDADIRWDPLDIIKLIVSDKELCGGLYPKKRYHWDRTKMLVVNNSSVPSLNYKFGLVDYVVNLTPEKYHENEMLSVKHIGTGFMLIRRICLEKMISWYPETKYDDDTGGLSADENRFCYSLFDCCINDGHYLSEDYLFCKRWTDRGNKLFADLTINLAHNGTTAFEGNPLQSFSMKK